MQEAFLSDFKALEPELCITAAYGNILPTKFLKIPSMGQSKDFNSFNLEIAGICSHIYMGSYLTQ